MTFKLNQAIALLRSAKGRGEGALDGVYHQIQKTPLMQGVSKSYKPRDEEGEKLPAEGTKLQIRVVEVLAEVVAPMSRLLDLTMMVDVGNQSAVADVKVGDVTILQRVPVSTLLALEKKMVDFATVVSKLPVLDPAEDWVDAGDRISWKTPQTSKVRTKKIPRVLEKSPATDRHPAQVEVWYEDLVVGDWTTVIFSGAITPQHKRELTRKVAQLQEALKFAREEANNVEIQDVKIGEKIFTFLGWKQQ